MTKDIKGRIKRTCLVCNNDGTTYETKEEYKEIIPCPKCNGSFVDIWFKEKYKRNNDKPLLTIELQDETSVPKVFYKGEEVLGKIKVSFDWETDTDFMGGLTYAIEHHEKNNYPVVNTIERRVRGHALD